ncbi:hypothetical protein BI49514_02329 [Brevibacterium iodinum ATCC 49514]|uniref:Uncharacterized protein n=1 Tax=Brevibacterium iodinum ATCC 49514 TaxID=1255616 RepID=A0A2H1JT73_9MICO|nr:hypothetical protein [Brevibacterium iodinum]SMX90686.1 hypothetical protein BI49514_02329 [Brevibacterium iodinum ATCC 49514]SUW12428.1 Uncharacterised protein [Brevibacterium iodinum]
MADNTEFNIPDGPQPGAPEDVHPAAVKITLISQRLNENVQRTKGREPNTFEQTFVFGYIAGLEANGQAVDPDEYDSVIAKALEAAAPLHD